MWVWCWGWLSIWLARTKLVRVKCSILWDPWKRVRVNVASIVSLGAWMIANPRLCNNILSSRPSRYEICILDKRITLKMWEYCERYGLWKQWILALRKVALTVWKGTQNGLAICLPPQSTTQHCGLWLNCVLEFPDSHIQSLGSPKWIVEPQRPRRTEQVIMYRGQDACGA